MELSGQADNGEHGYQCLGDEGYRVKTIGCQCADKVGIADLGEQIAETVVEAVSYKKANRDKGHQFDDRLKGNRLYHAAMVLG